MADHIYTIQCRGMEELVVATAALDAYRKGAGSAEPAAAVAGGKTAGPADPAGDLADRIEAALRKSVPNRARTVLLDALLQTLAGTWLPFEEIEAAFERAGLGVEKARAALGYFSWQMKEYMPAADLAGLTKSIEVMAERTRTDGEHMYRLTPAGRIAVERVIGPALAA